MDRLTTADPLRARWDALARGGHDFRARCPLHGGGNTTALRGTVADIIDCAKCERAPLPEETRR
jgi:hypothetical protein